MFTNIVHLFLGHHARKGEREGHVAQIFGDGEIAALVAEFLAVKGLEVDGRKVGAAGNAHLCQRAHHRVTLRRRLDADDVNEPTHSRRSRRDVRYLDQLLIRQPFVVPLCDARTFGEQFFDARHLCRAQCRAHLIEPIVVAEPRVIEPRIEHIAPLVAERTEEIRPLVVIGDDHAPFAGRDLLVGIESEYCCVLRIACCVLCTDTATFVFRANRFAGVFDDGEIVCARDVEQRIHIGRLAKGVDGEDGF